MPTFDRLRELGQSVWLDFLDHELIASGELDRLVQDGLRGLTSNPTIFAKAISKSADYDDLVREAAPGDADACVFERIEVREVGLACERLRSVYDASGGLDGFVSVEVSPKVARDTDRTVEEARRLWSSIDRPNLMVKIPGTREGLPAIERCLTDGINVNITLLFAVERYVEVAHAYLRALEHRLATGKPVDRIASVASFFVSRVDTKVDAAIDAAGPGRRGVRAEKGRAAIANAKLAFLAAEGIRSDDVWKRLERRGARPQRLLWASTSVKDPAYPELYYAEALVGPRTVDTMTRETLRAYAERGQPEARLGLGSDEASAFVRSLPGHGVDFAAATRELLDEGVQAFSSSYDEALATISEKRRQFRTGHAGPSTRPRGDRPSR